MIRSRYDRGVAATRARYVAATARLREAMRVWWAAAVPIDVSQESVPAWTAEQAAAVEQVAAAFADLVARRREWESLLRDLGYER
jgi:hypothetical protein